MSKLGILVLFSTKNFLVYFYKALSIKWKINDEQFCFITLRGEHCLSDHLHWSFGTDTSHRFWKRNTRIFPICKSGSAAEPTRYIKVIGRSRRIYEWINLNRHASYNCRGLEFQCLLLQFLFTMSTYTFYYKTKR